MQKSLVALFLAVGLAVADHHHDGAPEKDPAHPWIGAWESTGRSENFDNFVKAIDAGQTQPFAAGTHKVWHKLWKEGDHFHHKIAVPDKQYKNDVQFKLNEDGNGNFNNTAFTYKYTEQGNELHAVYTIASKGKTIHDTFKVNGDELEKTYKVDDVVAKRWYKRTTAPPPGASQA